MAIIYSYPEKTSPAGGDFLVITDSEQAAPNKNRTKSLTIDNLASYITTSTGGITGGGTSGRIPKWLDGPNGVLSDSFIKQEIVAANNIVTIDGDNGFIDILDCDQVSAPTLFTTNITAEGTGNVILKGGVIIGDQSTDILQITSKVSDSTGTGSTAAGEILVSNATGQLVWDDASDIVSGAVIKLVPYFQTATPGGSATYTELNNVVDFDWSGGSGTYEYILPSATAIPYRTIRFVNNSTITASTKVHITAPIGETIDGGAFYEINKAYNGCAVWSDGTEWIVIQAKA